MDLSLLPDDVRPDWVLLRKQAEFIGDDRTPELLYSGAFGAGKTRALCMKAVLRAWRPGAREGLCRKTSVAVKATTLRTLLERDGDLPPVLHPSLYTHNQTKQQIRLASGGEIYYFGVADARQNQLGSSRVGSLQLTGCAVDECVELVEDEWTMLIGRSRVRVAGLTNQTYGACNPGPPAHWLAHRFGLAPGTEADVGCRAIRTQSHDNAFLPETYVEALDRFVGLRHRRYVLGEWVGSSGLVYDQWLRERHVRERDLSEFDSFEVWIDEGFSAPFAALLVGFDSLDRAHVFEEVYERQLQRGDKIDRVLRLVARVCGDVRRVVVDSAAAELIAALRREDLPVEGALKHYRPIHDGTRSSTGESAVTDQILHVVQPRLLDDATGHPMLTVSPECPNVAIEFETYEWAPATRSALSSYTGEAARRDVVVKADDHAIDAIRYGLVAHDRASRFSVEGSDLGEYVAESSKDRYASWDEWRESNPDAGWEDA